MNRDLPSIDVEPRPRVAKWLSQAAGLSLNLLAGGSLRVAAWASAGLASLVSVMNLGTVPAVVGLLGASTLGFAYLAATHRRGSASPPEDPEPAVHLLRLLDRSDRASTWPLDLVSAGVMAFPAVILWSTAFAYLGHFGPEASVGWFLATAFSVIPPTWFLGRAVSRFVELVRANREVTTWPRATSEEDNEAPQLSLP